MSICERKIWDEDCRSAWGHICSLKNASEHVKEMATDIYYDTPNSCEKYKILRMIGVIFS